MNEELRYFKSRYVGAFVTALLTRIGAVAAVLILGEQSPLLFLFGLANIAAVLAFLYYTCRFVRALGFGVLGTIGLFLCHLIPLVNLVTIVVLIRKYSEVSGVKLNFFMQDVEPAA